MNINKLTQFLDNNNDDGVIYANSTRRAFASAIDAIIVLFLRIIILTLMNAIYIKSLWEDFYNELYTTFGTRTLKRVPEHINFVTQHPAFIITLLSIGVIIMIGAVYHAYLNSSSKQGTLGKQLLKIKMVKEPHHDKITFGLGMSHYFLSVAPFLYVFYIANYQISNNLTFFAAITHNYINIIFGAIFILWVHLHLIAKKKTTAYDLICKTSLIRR